MKYLFLIFYFTISLSGCGMGGWWMNGDPNIGREPYRPEYLDWFKEGAEKKDLQGVWLACGGTKDGMVHLPSSGGYLTVDKSNEYEEKYYQVQSCMIRKGYRYIGECNGPVKLRLACKSR